MRAMTELEDRALGTPTNKTEDMTERKPPSELSPDDLARIDELLAEHTGGFDA
jgi:hypothetical protein